MITAVAVLVMWICVAPPGNHALAADEETDAPLPASVAAETMKVPDGFHVTLFAGEPDVKQPIGFCIDDRGRLWVAEAYNYPVHGTKAGDRIIILEDEDHDGRFDKRTVFFDKLNYVTGIEVGFGGAWVMSPPYFYFIPDRDGDDVPDAEPQVLLDGFGNHANAHNLANGFAWGPDGWLYGTHGRTNWSMIGKPGTSEGDRVRFDGGVYRYHPIRQEWEPFADGTTNPWGIDWNDYGDAFVCNCVNPHLFQVIEGAHYEPWRNRDSSRFAYERIDTIADHLHFTGTKNVRDGLGSDDEDLAGGGHAHCGTMIYLGDNWPDRYRNSVFMNNIHGKRINNDILRREGSGYRASHGSDVMRSQDSWFMGVTLTYGPDGSVFVSDWSDTGECHSVRNTRRETGRIFKISFGDPEARPVDISSLTNRELVELQSHRNDWYVRHARRVLQERFAAGHDLSESRAELHAIFGLEQDIPRRLRALWALHVTGGLDEEFLLQLLDDSSEHVRSWGVRLLSEDRAFSEATLNRFETLAKSGDSQHVRLQLCSALQKMDPAERWGVAKALLSRREDRDDANLPLMLWYGLEPLVDEDVEQFVGLISVSEIPLVTRHIARRVASRKEDTVGLNLLAAVLGRTTDELTRGEVLNGILTGLEGRRTVPLPVNWPSAFAQLQHSNDPAIRRQSIRLALIFGDPTAIQTLRTVANDRAASAAQRNDAIEALVARKTDGLAPMLLQLLSDPVTRIAALHGLAEYNDPDTADAILREYATFTDTTRPHAIQTLASRRSWAMQLLDAVEAERIPRSDLSAFTARQLRSLGDPQVLQRVHALWGELRETDADRARQIADYKRRLSRDADEADPQKGRVTFNRICASCHRLFDEGGKIGPDITGSQRRNLDYVLENLVDPNSAVSKDYQMEIFLTQSGRTVTGLVVAENENALTVQSVNERIVIPLDEIDERSASSKSMMPDGLLNPLSYDEVRDLISYLGSERQIPLPESATQPAGTSP